MKVELNKGIGFDPEISLTIEMNCKEILTYLAIIRKVVKDKPLNHDEKLFFSPILKQVNHEWNQ